MLSRYALWAASCPNVLLLQSKEKLYFVLDYLQGGELFFHLKNNRRFPEDVARTPSRQPWLKCLLRNLCGRDWVGFGPPAQPERDLPGSEAREHPAGRQR